MISQLSFLFMELCTTLSVTLHACDSHMITVLQGSFITSLYRYCKGTIYLGHKMIQTKVHNKTKVFALTEIVYYIKGLLKIHVYLLELKIMVDIWLYFQPGQVKYLEEGPSRCFQPSQMISRKKKNKDLKLKEVLSCKMY